jgi:drug/metabolite transporter (DMT)-like permease
MAKNKANMATGALLFGVVFWAATFVVIKEAVEFVDVYSFISVRFFIAAGILSLIFFKRFRNYNSEVLKKGVLIGIVLAVSFILQVIGIKFTTASDAAFITALSVVLVPIFVCSIDRKLPRAMQTLATTLAFVGLALLTVKPGFNFNVGDMWVLLCAVAFGIHLIMISRMVRKIDIPLFTITQFLTVAIISAVLGILFNGQIVISDQFVVWRAILFCAIFASAYMYTAQARFQRYITEIKAAIIYSFEPLFAAVMAFFYLGETLTFQAITGGILIFIGMLLSEFKIKPKPALPEV